VLWLVAIAIFFYGRFQDAGRGKDFLHFYCAAKIVLSGLGHQLYEVPLQWQFQLRYTGRIGNFFVHPPYQILLYIPFVALPVGSAYFAWTIFSLTILAAIAWLTSRRFDFPPRPSLSLALSLSFTPVVLSLLQGQDSILLLLCFALAFAALESDKDFAAGCFLAFGLFKFQFVLPVAITLFATRKKAFAAGFAAVACLLLILSASLVGPSSLAAYPRFLLRFDEIPFSGVYPGAMPNFRGGLEVIFGPSSPLSRVTLIFVSLLVLVIAIDGGRCRPSIRSAERLKISNTVIAAILVSYQAGPHDLTLLLLPIALTWAYLHSLTGRTGWRLGSTLILGALTLPPLYVYLLRVHQYVVLVLPMTALLAMNYAEIRHLGSAVRPVDRAGEGESLMENPGFRSSLR